MTVVPAQQTGGGGGSSGSSGPGSEGPGSDGGPSGPAAVAPPARVHLPSFLDISLNVDLSAAITRRSHREGQPQGEGADQGSEN